jgi:hypothetical protein
MPFRCFSPRDLRFHPSKRVLKKTFPERMLSIAIFLQLLLQVFACNTPKSPYNLSWVKATT